MFKSLQTQFCWSMSLFYPVLVSSLRAPIFKHSQSMVTSAGTWLFKWEVKSYVFQQEEQQNSPITCLLESPEGRKNWFQCWLKMLIHSLGEDKHLYEMLTSWAFGAMQGKTHKCIVCEWRSKKTQRHKYCFMNCFSWLKNIFNFTVQSKQMFLMF